jgi:hypothetical protein
LIPDPALQDAERPQPPEPGPDPVHGTTRYIERDILDWPEHWQRANGLRADDLVLHGATHTVADLLALTPDVPLRATVAARVMSLAASGTWTRVRVDDGSGKLDVSCPYQTTLLGPTLGQWYEFDVVVPAGKVTTPPDPQAAAAGIEDPVEQLAAEYLARYGGKSGAIAQAVRACRDPRKAPFAYRIAQYRCFCFPWRLLRKRCARRPPPAASIGVMTRGAWSGGGTGECERVAGHAVRGAPVRRWRALPCGARA